MSTERHNATPEELAKYWKYFKQLGNKNVVRKQTLAKIPFISCYKDHKKNFDGLCKIVNKYHIDYVKYMNYCILDVRVEKPSELLHPGNIRKFAEYLNTKDYYYKIYKLYVKSAENVANDCIKFGFKSTSEYIKALITKNLLAEEFITGRISRYYIATIQNFKKVYNFLDQINKDELHIIYEVCDKLNQDVQDAFLMYKNHQVHPIGFTDALIQTKLNH